MGKIAITGVGPDRPGIVAALTKVLDTHRCNIEDASMTILAGQFAMILVVAVPDNLADEVLEKDLLAVEENVGVVLHTQPVSESDIHTPASDGDGQYLIAVSGEDHVGITHEVAGMLAEFAVNITDLNSQVIDGETGPVYMMMIEVRVPESLETAALNSALQSLAGEQNVEISIQPVEALVL